MAPPAPPMSDEEPIKLRHEAPQEVAPDGGPPQEVMPSGMADGVRIGEAELEGRRRRRVAEARKRHVMSRPPPKKEPRHVRAASTLTKAVRLGPRVVGTAREHPAVASVVAVALLGLCVMANRRRRAASRRLQGRSKRGDFNRWDPRAGSAPSFSSTALPPTVKRACQRGDREAVLQWLGSADADARDSDGRTALHHAAMFGHAELARALLENAASPDLPDVNGQAPLHAAAHAGSASAVRVLLDAGADVKLEDHTAQTPLLIAQSAGNHGCARLIQRRERAISKAVPEDAAKNLHLRHNKLDDTL
ncbi:hypothetical protein CTAYLR_008572 [Chrysophaeum taylorii]|uniref:Uncharacterized protein n=1 Tax=Chrysophaeum taylorii TaxID=2483200 RepID=A0AAD7UET8_9STRA|nr:hypothetical protein CTAYLR_008572 [Chrysophaeum taylorii]